MTKVGLVSGLTDVWQTTLYNVRSVEKLKISKTESEEKVTRTKSRKKIEFSTGDEDSHSARRATQGIYVILKLSLCIKMPFTRYYQIM